MHLPLSCGLSSSQNNIETVFTSLHHDRKVTLTIYFASFSFHSHFLIASPLLTPKYRLFFCHCESFLDCWSGPTVNISSIALPFLNRFTASQGESRIPISDSHAEPFRQILFLPDLHPLLGPNNLPFNPPFLIPLLPFFLQNLQVEGNLCLLI